MLSYKSMPREASSETTRPVGVKKSMANEPGSDKYYQASKMLRMVKNIYEINPVTTTRLVKS